MVFGMLVLSSLSTVAFATSCYAAEAKDWTLNLKDVDIRVFLEQVSNITGENFVVDPAVKGKVSVIATTPMNAKAVNELLLTVLRVNGFAAIKAGDSTRVVPLANAKGASPMDMGDTSQKVVTRVIPVKNVNIEEAAKILKPMVSPQGYLEGSVYSNAIVVSDYADSVAQIAKALESLEKESPAEVEVIPLKEAWVGNVSPLIEAMSPTQLGDGKGRNRLRVVADERSNSIVVRGDAKERAQIRKLVQTLDQKNPNSSDIQMIRLQNADAKQMAAMLRGIVFNAKGGGGQAPAPTPATPGTEANAAALSSLFGAPANVKPGAVEPEDTTTQSFIQADVALNAIVVRAEPAVMSEIRSLVRQLDVRRPQVMIEAAIVEITADKTEQLGVQLAGGDFAQKIHGVTTQFSQQNPVSLGTLLTQLSTASTQVTPGEGVAVALGNSNFDILIQALANTTGANLLSTPSITTLDNEEAKIVVGQNVPFRTGSFSTLNSGIGNPFTTIERQDIGITLKVIPQIHEGNLVKLNIAQEVSSIADSTQPDAADLITNKRTINTNIVAEDGETIVLGGLMQDDSSQSVSKIPVLGDIPVVGALFSSKRQENTKRNLFVFLRPTVLLNRGDAKAVTQMQYGRVYDLQMGTRDLNDPKVFDRDAPKEKVPAPAAATVFDPPPKQLPWLLD